MEHGDTFTARIQQFLRAVSQLFIRCICIGSALVDVFVLTEEHELSLSVEETSPATSNTNYSSVRPWFVTDETT